MGTDTSVMLLPRAKLITLTAVVVLQCWSALPANAGPPFATDDPEPTEYRNWEIYLGGTSASGQGAVDAELPFAEFNYGLMPNVQFSVSVPMEFTQEPAGEQHYAGGGPDVGLKLRFVQERDGAPQVSFYPSVQFAGASERGPARVFLPLWAQKSWGPWTVYGGGGHWLNAGAAPNSTFGGLAVLRKVSPASTLGAEVYGSSASAAGENAPSGFNVGALLARDDRHAFVLSAGHSLGGRSMLTGYAALELMLGPHHAP